jgi:hypothetical protein
MSVSILSKKLVHQINQAKRVCKTKPICKACIVAWDQVEELSSSLHKYKVIEKRQKLERIQKVSELILYSYENNSELSAYD